MDIKKYYLVAALFMSLIVLAVLFFSGGADQPPSLTDPVPSPEERDGDPSEPRPTRTVVLFFLTEGDFRLHPEEREILAHDETVIDAKQTIVELIRGPLDEGISAIPEGTRLREMYISREGIAYVDFSRELRENHPSGTAAEVATVFAIVNSLTSNYKSIKRVSILIDGNERETLNGHVDLTRPLLPRLDLIVR
jgi:spore germination protein GerM